VEKKLIHTKHVTVQGMIEGEDFYLERGRMVLTKEFLLKRGKCCHHRCRHCPWKKRKRVDKEQSSTYTDGNKV
jgi:hypothetical protein